MARSSPDLSGVLSDRGGDRERDWSSRDRGCVRDFPVSLDPTRRLRFPTKSRHTKPDNILVAIDGFIALFLRFGVVIFGGLWSFSVFYLVGTCLSDYKRSALFIPCPYSRNVSRYWTIVIQRGLVGQLFSGCGWHPGCAHRLPIFISLFSRVQALMVIQTSWSDRHHLHSLLFQFRCGEGSRYYHLLISSML